MMLTELPPELDSIAHVGEAVLSHPLVGFSHQLCDLGEPGTGEAGGTDTPIAIVLAKELDDNVVVVGAAAAKAYAEASSEEDLLEMEGVLKAPIPAFDVHDLPRGDLIVDLDVDARLGLDVLAERHQASGALAAIDVIEHDLVEDLLRRARRRG